MKWRGGSPSPVIVRRIGRRTLFRQGSCIQDFHPFVRSRLQGNDPNTATPGSGLAFLCVLVIERSAGELNMHIRQLLLRHP
ncbi:MAG: hypothetical protein ACI8QS_001178 [Planctomycetota bacterium]|jgi:hypothetical protein